MPATDSPPQTSAGWRRRRWITASLPGAVMVALQLPACASLQHMGCGPGLHRAELDTLYFGTASANGTVSPEDWTSFSAREIAPLFAQGFTTLDATGSWLTRDGTLQQEKSYVVQFVHPSGKSYDRQIAQIITRYRGMFHQESALRLRSHACAAF